MRSLRRDYYQIQLLRTPLGDGFTDAADFSCLPAMPFTLIPHTIEQFLAAAAVHFDAQAMSTRCHIVIYSDDFRPRHYVTCIFALGAIRSRERRLLEREIT